MAHLKIIASLVLSLSLVSARAADYVTIPNVFTAGTAAKASEVNANFDALAAAVNSLSATVDKLNVTVGTLGALTGIGTDTVPGTYYYYASEIQVGNTGVENALVTGILVLNDDRTVTVSVTRRSYTMYVPCPGTYDNASDGSTNNIKYFTDSQNYSGTAGTWALNGSKLTLTLDTDTVELSAATMNAFFGTHFDSDNSAAACGSLLGPGFAYLVRKLS